MDGVTGPSRIYGSTQVHERKGGNQQQADAFRQAMEEHEGGTAAEREPEAPTPKTPVRRGLQPNRPDSRKLEEEVHHVDVVA